MMYEKEFIICYFGIRCLMIKNYFLYSMSSKKTFNETKCLNRKKKVLMLTKWPHVEKAKELELKKKVNVDKINEAKVQIVLKV